MIEVAWGGGADTQPGKWSKFRLMSSMGSIKRLELFLKGHGLMGGSFSFVGCGVTLALFWASLAAPVLVIVFPPFVCIFSQADFGNIGSVYQCSGEGQHGVGG